MRTDRPASPGSVAVVLAEHNSEPITPMDKQKGNKMLLELYKVAKGTHQDTMNEFFESVEIMDEQTAKADGLEILNLAREIINQNDTDRTIETASLDSQFELVNIIADNALEYLPDGQTKPDLNYSEISANNSKEICELCEKVALWTR